MKINKEQTLKAIKFLEENYLDYIEKYKMRKGQFLWNMFASMFTEIVEPLRGASNNCDPYYLDERIPTFMEAICDEEALQVWYESEFYKTKMI